MRRKALAFGGGLSVISAALLLGCGGAQTAASGGGVDLAREVEATERAFAATMAKRDFAGFQSFLSDETVFLSGPSALRGKDKVSETWKRFYVKPEAPFSWEPEHVEVLDSGTLALSTGPVLNAKGKRVATFNSIWRREADGWRIVFDRGVDYQECADAPADQGEPSKTSAPNEGVSPRQPDFAAYRQSLVDADAAYRRKDFAAFVKQNERAVAALPNSPRAMYNLACGYALSGKKAESLLALERLVGLGLSFDVMADEDLSSLRGDPGFTEVRARFEAQKTPVEKSSAAFKIPERDMLAEGIAYDPQTGAFFVGSVHKRKIVRIDPKGIVKDFVSEGRDGLFGVLGMAVDPKRRSLWAISAAILGMKGFVAPLKGKGALVEFDLATGKTRRSVAIDDPDTAHHVLNDLAVDEAGGVFVSDPGASTLFLLSPEGKKLEPFVGAGQLASPQGIALSADGKAIYVADYSRGLARIDRTSREVEFLAPPADATLLGIDGLIAYGGDLLAIQNGVRPHRIVRISLDPSGKSIRGLKVLEKNHSAWNEPTLGVVVGRELFYVANSQWSKFEVNGRGEEPALDELKEPFVSKLGLE